MKCPAMLFASLMTMVTTIPTYGKPMVGLESLQWKHRVLLVFAQGSFANHAMSNLNEQAANIEERDLVWFLLAGNELHTNHNGTLERGFREQLLQRYFTPAPAGPSVILIGKDGSVKSKGSDLDLAITFELIDRMPMRKAEMQRRR